MKLLIFFRHQIIKINEIFLKRLNLQLIMKFFLNKIKIILKELQYKS